jgi:uncharacterized phage-associated protein
MASPHDVAQYILEKTGEISTIKLQKLVYYCQAWHIVWEEIPLFSNKVEAWANGPVVPDLYQSHKGLYSIGPKSNIGNSSNLKSNEKESIDVVVNEFGDKPTQWLVELTHLEDPWKEARGSCLPGERCTKEISLSSMAEYYSGL